MQARGTFAGRFAVGLVIVTGLMMEGYAQPPLSPTAGFEAPTETLPSNSAQFAGGSSPNLSRNLPPAPQRLLPTRAAGTSAGRNGKSAPSAAPLWGTVLGLICLAGGLTVAARWIRRHGPAVLRALPNDAVEPLGQRVLSRGVAVHLVRCGSRMLLLGVGPDGVRTLAEISDPVEIDLLAGACQRRDEQANGLASFGQLLQRGPRPAAGREVEVPRDLFGARTVEVPRG